MLRKLRITDLDNMWEYSSKDNVTKYMTWDTYTDIGNLREYLQSVIDRNSPYDFAIALKESDKLIGTINFVNIDETNRVGVTGYILSDKYWNQGYMTEALRKVIEYGFNKLNLNRIEARHIVENIASGRVMQKAGMKFEGILRQQQFVKGAFRDVSVYSILKDEFLK